MFTTKVCPLDDQGIDSPNILFKGSYHPLAFEPMGPEVPGMQYLLPICLHQEHVGIVGTMIDIEWGDCYIPCSDRFCCLKCLDTR